MLGCRSASAALRCSADDVAEPLMRELVRDHHSAVLQLLARRSCLG